MDNLLLMFAPIFIIGGLWFWVALVGLGCWMIYVTETESRFLAVFTGIGILGVIWGVYNISPWAILTHYGWTIPLAIIGYLAIGCVWSMARWALWTNYLFESVNFTDEPSREDKLALLGGVLRARRDIIGDFPPSPTEYKARIVFWITNWPFSLIWTVLNDPLRKIVDFLYRRLGKVYSGITNWITDRHLGKV